MNSFAEFIEADKAVNKLRESPLDGLWNESVKFAQCHLWYLSCGEALEKRYRHGFYCMN